MAATTPCNTAATTVDPIMNDTTHTGPGPLFTGTPAILYVDDEPKSVKYFSKALQRDFPILSAAGAAAAEAILESDGDRVGVLISDQRMPVRSGVQLLAWTKERYPHIVRVLTTAYADLEAAVDAVNRGEIYRYILKPWNIEVLRSELRDAMELYLRRRREQELLQARRGTMLALASQIAHELRTPLASVRAAMYGLEDCMPELVQAYRRDAARGGRSATIAAAHLRTLEQTPAEVTKVVSQANNLINLLLMNAREEGSGEGGYGVFSMLRCIREAVARYPFKDGERELVRLEGKDFAVRGADVLFTYVIYNLLKNALSALKGGGEIVVRLQPGAPFNRVWFRDTGSGIAADILPYIFEEFYSGCESGRGTGMGLSFCRRVVTGFGGAIECRSREREYTEFEMRFPRQP